MADPNQQLDLTVHTFKAEEIETSTSTTDQQTPEDAGMQESRPPRRYQRYPKPPYTYMGMIAMAIHTSRHGRLQLEEICKALCDMFHFFRGEYQGWRNTVRNVLTRQECFILMRSDKKTKHCFWSVDISLLPEKALFRTSNQQSGIHWASTLTRHLGIADIDLIPKKQSQWKQPTQQRRQQLDILHPGVSSSFAGIPENAGAESIRVSHLHDRETDRPYHVMASRPTKQTGPRVSVGEVSRHHHHQQKQDPMKSRTINRRSCGVADDHEGRGYASLLFKYITSHTHPVTYSLCPAPRYGETTPMSTPTSMSRAFTGPDSNVLCSCLDDLPLQEPQPAFRLHLEDWSLASMQSTNDFS